jgi:hypothetical protein
MSFSRLALRLAAVEALCPAAALPAGPFPTVAGPRVYDSRIDLIQANESPEALAAALAAIENKPLVSVYTEEQRTEPYGTVKYSASENVVTLVIEAMIAASGVTEVTLPDGTTQEVGTIEAPVTSREHEALLDVLEGQVRFLLSARRNEMPAPSAELYRKVAMEVRSIESQPLRAADRTLRLAARTIKFEVKIPGESWPSPTATGLDRFPEPLAMVAKALPAGSSGAALVTSLAPMPPEQPAVPTDPVEIVIDLQIEDP